MSPLNPEVEPLFLKYKDRVYHLAISIVHNDSDAKDIVQNTFIKILKNLPNFRRQSDISTWIYRIAYNESLMHLRGKYRQFRITNRISKEGKITDSGMFINWAKIPDSELLKKELKGRLQEAISNIPIKYRMPLLLHHMEDMSLRRSAEVLGISLASLKSRLHRSILMASAPLFQYFKDEKTRQQKPAQRGCSRSLRFIYDYASGNLELRIKNDFKTHISKCVNCAKFVNDYAKAISITRGLECRDLPPELHEKIKFFLSSKK